MSKVTKRVYIGAHSLTIFKGIEMSKTQGQGKETQNNDRIC